MQRTTERSRQPLPFVTNNVQDSAIQIAVSNTAGTSTRYEESNITRYPVPRPRTKSNLKPVVNNNLSIYQGSSEIFFQGTSEGELHSSQSGSGFDDNFLGDLLEMNNMSHERSQNSIVSRIKAFESQGESSEHPKRPEVAPRSINTRGAVTTKPILAPKPLSNRISGEWDPGKDNKPKFAPREGLLLSSLQDTSGVTKPDLPKKPKPNLSKSNSNEFPDGLLGASTSNSKESERKLPVPAPRPLLPKKSIQTDNLVSVSVGAKPLVPAPKFSVASQAKAFNIVETPAARVMQSKSVGDLDLINFDEDVLTPVLPSPDVIGDSKTSVGKNR